MILHVLTSMQLGGAPQTVLTLAVAMMAKGVSVAVAGPAGPMAEQFRQHGVSVYHAPTDHICRQGFRSVHTAAAGAEVIVSHGKGAAICADRAAQHLGIPHVRVMHGLHYESYSAHVRWAYLAWERRLARRSAAMIFLSQADAREAAELGIVAPHQAVVPNGLDAASLRRRALSPQAAWATLGLPGGVRVVGTVARLDPVKRIDLLIEAVALIPDVVLVLIGTGPEQAHLRHRSIEVGVAERVYFAGAHVDAALLMPAFDVFATASAREGCPLAVLEAMALGVPVVASDIPAHAEMLPADCLAPARIEVFADRLRLALHERILLSSPSNALWCLANEDRVRMRYSVEQMVEGHQRVYEAVLEREVAA